MPEKEKLSVSKIHILKNNRFIYSFSKIPLCIIMVILSFKRHLHTEYLLFDFLIFSNKGTATEGLYVYHKEKQKRYYYQDIKLRKETHPKQIMAASDLG